MHPDTPPAPPRAHPELVQRLREDLRQADYSTERTEELLGEIAVEALRREDPIPARRVLAGLTDPAAAMLSLFTLGADLASERVAEVLPTLGIDGAVELGILAPASAGSPDAARASDGAGSSDAAGLLRATIDLSPYAAQDDHGDIAWWIASDRSELATGRALHPDHVLGIGGASLTLARITPRERADRVLDLGCGCGIQALHASRHADHVVATDFSPRALDFTAFNAALNQVDLDLRQGSLLDPVAGETFDLIVSNPPFVITPRSTDEDQQRWTYRDGGRAGDTLLAELLEQLPEHLRPQGTAVMLGNWERTAGEDWDAHPRAWSERARSEGLDCWVIQRESEDPAQYAGTWARDGGVTPGDERWQGLIEAWLNDFEQRGVQQIGFGYMLLRRRSEQPAVPAVSVGRLRTEQVTGTGSGTVSTHLAAGLRMMQTLDALSDEQLGALRPRRSADLVERRHLVPGAWDPSLIELVQGAGFARAVPADQALAATVGALDGTLTLGQTIAAVCALTGDDPDATRERLLPQVRELLITGMLEL